jgi:hypothetical protein
VPDEEALGHIGVPGVADGGDYPHDRAVGRHQARRAERAGQQRPGEHQLLQQVTGQYGGDQRDHRVRRHRPRRRRTEADAGRQQRLPRHEHHVVDQHEAAVQQHGRQHADGQRDGDRRRCPRAPVAEPHGARLESHAITGR